MTRTAAHLQRFAGHLLTQDYWDSFYENETGKRYFFTEPTSPDQTRMFIESGRDSNRIFLLSEEAEESFFEHPE